MVEASKELIVKVGVVWLRLVSKHLLNLVYQVVLSAWLIFNIDGDELSKLLGRIEINHSLLSLESPLKEVSKHLPPSVDELPVVLRVYPLFLHLFNNILFKQK